VTDVTRRRGACVVETTDRNGRPEDPRGEGRSGRPPNEECRVMSHQFADERHAVVVLRDLAVNDRRRSRWLVVLGLMIGRPAMPYCVFVPAALARTIRRAS
jgi:hypothetical protein